MVTLTSGVAEPAELLLYARGPARLRGPGGNVRLRRKALALFYYLAFEGPTRRERLADLLWDSADPLSNLRVELNAINAALRHIPLTFSDNHQDPLVLPRQIRLDLDGSSRDEVIMDGLDGLSADFQEWLEWQRARLRASAGPGNVRLTPEVEARISSLRAPHLLVVEPLPCQTAQDFAEAVALHLRMPLTAAPDGNGVHYAAPPYPAGLVELIQRNTSSIWVFERPFFGPDPDELLKLRALLPATELTYLRLAPLSWAAAVKGPLAQHGFDTASSIYLRACGHPGYIEELLTQKDPLQAPVMHRFSASIELEVRKLSASCRQLLQSLAVRSRAVAARRSEFADSVDCLTELVDRRWLEFTDSGWRFISPLARRILYHSMPDGVRQAAHRKQAESLEQLGMTVAAQLQRMVAGLEDAEDELTGQLEPWAAAVLEQRRGRQLTRLEPAGTTRVNADGQERFLEVRGTFGKGVEQDGDSVALVRYGQCAEATGITYSLPELPLLVHITGQANIDNHQGIGMLGNAVPLKLEFDAGAATVLAPELSAGLLGDLLVLPLPGSFDYWFACSGSQTLTVSSSAEAGVVQFNPRCYAWVKSGGSEQEAWVRSA